MAIYEKELSDVTTSANKQYLYAYKTVSVNHLPELQANIDELEKSNKISSNKVFRSYISSFKFEIPKDFLTAKSLIIMAVFTPPISLKFHFQDKIHQTMLPGNYSFTGINNDTLEEEILNNIIKKQGYSVKRTRNIHLKLLAVRSRLGKYGRNNICYVGEMGSFVNLMAFFTDYEFEEDTLGTIEMMEYCKSCQICIFDCPGQAIPKSERFIINIERCIPLYNEIPEKIPEWIPSSAHNALMGCMICQKNCPGNKKALPLTIQGGDILEEESKLVLDCNLEKAKELNLGEKIPIYFFNPEITLPGLDLLKRNLELILTQ